MISKIYLVFNTLRLRLLKLLFFKLTRLISPTLRKWNPLKGCLSSSVTTELRIIPRKDIVLIFSEAAVIRIIPHGPQPSLLLMMFLSPQSKTQYSPDLFDSKLWLISREHPILFWQSVSRLPSFFSLQKESFFCGWDTVWKMFDVSIAPNTSHTDYILCNFPPSEYCVWYHMISNSHGKRNL